MRPTGKLKDLEKRARRWLAILPPLVLTAVVPNPGIYLYHLIQINFPLAVYLGDVVCVLLSIRLALLVGAF